MTESVLIVEDEPEFATLMQLWIQRSGRQTWLATSGPEAMRLLWEHRPDLVTLDMGLPELDGWTVCERIRELSDVPIIIVSARGAESERVRGLEIGADDYIVKPFSFRELMARIDATLRRTRLERRAPGLLRHRALAVDPEEHRAWLDGRELDLTPLEFRLITLLAERSGRLVRHEELLRRAWGPEYAGEPQLLRSAIHGLRKKLRTPGSADGEDYIVAEYGLGYRLGPGSAPF